MSIENTLTTKQLVRFECAKIVSSLGVPAERIRELANPLSEWILTCDEPPSPLKSDDKE
jgi:hypothetical protein